MALPFIIVFVAALLAGLVLTAAVRRGARRLGLVDQPDGHRKLHSRAIPLGGGAAVFLATLAVLAPLYLLPNPWSSTFARTPDANRLALLLAAAVIVLLGLVDDRLQLRGRQKLLGQLIAITILVSSGLVIESFALFGLKIDLGLLALPFTYFWLLGAINSVNLLDGIDGLATMLGILLVATFAAIASLSGRPEVAIIAVAFAGALLGFFRYNFPPASVFLGDAGSMLIGLVVGTLAIQGSLKGPGTVLLAAPLAVWTIPIFDSAAAILRRRLTGRSIYTTDRAHIHHRLLDRFGNSRKVLGVVAAACAVTSFSALASVFLNSDLLALASFLGVVGVLVATGLFGRGEFELLARRIRRLARSLVTPRRASHPLICESAVQLQGSRHWGPLWQSLTESAGKLALAQVHLDVNLPTEHEEFNAVWERQPPVPDHHCWRLEIPLVVDSQPAGRLTVLGLPNGRSPCEEVGQLLAVLGPIEHQLRNLSEPQHAPPSPPERPSRPNSEALAQQEAVAPITPQALPVSGANATIGKSRPAQP